MSLPDIPECDSVDINYDCYPHLTAIIQNKKQGVFKETAMFIRSLI